VDDEQELRHSYVELQKDECMRSRRSEPVATGAAAMKILDTPLTVIDFETTGLDAGLDRVVEVCVARIDPGQPPRIVMDTLINPGRPMDATFIHGITEADVRHAPRFADISGDLVEAISGSVVTAYNVYFDVKFLRDELQRCGVTQTPPHLCLMYLKPLLGLGMKCGLRQACQELGVVHTGEHYAAIDVAASAKILARYLEEIRRQEIQTFQDLARKKRYKFFESLKQEPYESVADRLAGLPHKSRRTGVTDFLEACA
jgi:DNA polymerase-3 subunit epsilon